MNNRSIILTLVLTAFLVTGCKERHSKALDLAYKLSATAPDSALSILDGVKQSSLSKAERARYALVYTIAQDKSGLNVDNDSLLRIAYTYYNNRTDDSLYAKCEYYMGKYYMLNDSMEMAIDCLQKSADAAEKQRDKYTRCLALEKLSRVLRQTNPVKAVGLARLTERTYADLSTASSYNIVYSKLNVCEALLLTDSISQAQYKCEEALNIAKVLKDSNVLSDVYQDMAVIVRQRKDYSESLNLSKAAYNTCTTYDISKVLNLATAYLDTDSLASCNRLLDFIVTGNPEYKYIIFNIRHLAAIKEHEYEKSYNYADSAYHYLELMYGKELNSKQVYYNSLAETKYEKGIAKSEARLLTWLITLTAIFSLAIIILILYSYRQYRKTVKLRIEAGQDKLKQEEKIHSEELHHKEIQLSTMRNFILKRIDTAQKIQELRGNKSDNVLLTEEDWEEIRLFVDGVEGDFVTRLQGSFPNLDVDDIRLLMLVRLKMPTRALALIYKISEKSIKQKLFIFKAKVGISGEKTSLRSFIRAF